MTWIVVDVEADGPMPGDGPDPHSGFSMASFGAVPVVPEVTKASGYYSGILKPITANVQPGAVASHGVPYEKRAAEGREPGGESGVMAEFAGWLERTARGRCVFVSDNLAFDWQFINWYCWRFLGRNPFGFSGRRIGDLWAGYKNDPRAANTWKEMRKTPHTHHPLDDALGNAEALLEMK